MAQDYLRDFYLSRLGGWAGQKIVCAGEYVKPDFYPPGLFSAEELDVLRQKTIDSLDPEDYNEDPYYYADEWDYNDLPKVDVPFSLYHFAQRSVFSLQEDEGHIYRSSQREYRTCVEDRVGPNQRDGALFRSKRSQMHLQTSDYFPEDEPWILRN